MNEIRKTNEIEDPNERLDSLTKIRQKLTDPKLLTPEVVQLMLLSFRDIQAYDQMVQLCEDLEKSPQWQSNAQIQYLFAFALSRRNMAGDREACLAAGMNDYVSKPIRPAELAGALQRAPSTGTAAEVSTT